MAPWFHSLLAQITVTCEEIKSCPAKTPDVGSIFTNVIHGIIGVIGGLAVIFLIVAGLQMVMSNGDPKRFAQGRASLQYAVIGIILSILAYFIVSAIATIFTPGGLNG